MYLLCGILFASNNLSLLNQAKEALSQHFDMIDLKDAFFVLGIEIHHDRSQGFLGFS